MDGHRRITVRVDARDLELAQEFTGKGVSETVRIALRLHAQELSQRRAAAKIGRGKCAK
jgi:hypothetical protein